MVKASTTNRSPRARSAAVCCVPWLSLATSLLSLAASAVLSPLSAAEQVRIGVARTISDVGYYVADAMGFFREEGLEVSIVGFASAAQMVAPLGTGELQVGGGTVSAGFYNAVGRGIAMNSVGSWI
jgi:NitT/TauT family transport system substrate-binding protein